MTFPMASARGELVNGPEAITPDSRPLLGPVPGLRGYYVAAGLSHTGFGGGGAIGQIVSMEE